MLKILLISVPFLFVIGSLMHFVYRWSGKNKIVGVFAPVNESIFEHSKLLLFPLLFFWIILYFFINDIDENNYFFAMLISIVTSIVCMFSFYYTYKEIIGKGYLWIDVFDLLFSLFIGQILANHVYVYGGGMSVLISIIIIVFLVFGYAYLTFKPFKTPLFLDEKTKTYGINEEKQA